MDAQAALVPGTDDLLEEFIQDMIDGAVQRDPTSPRFAFKRALFEKPFVRLHKRPYYKPFLPAGFCRISTCLPGTRRTFVAADGKYYPCERTIETPLLQIGDIDGGIWPRKVKDLLDTWVAATRRNCPGCWCLPLCSVGCFALLEDDDLRKAKTEECDRWRRSMHNLLILYCRVLEQNGSAFDYMANMVTS